MKKIFLMLLLATTAAQADRSMCATITSSMAFTSILESSEYCGFDKMLPEKLMVEYKQFGCDSVLSEDDRLAIMAIIADDTANGFIKLGKKGMCKRSKPSYDKLAGAL